MFRGLMQGCASIRLQIVLERRTLATRSLRMLVWVDGSRKRLAVLVCSCAPLIRNKILLNFRRLRLIYHRMAGSAPSVRQLTCETPRVQLGLAGPLEV